MATQKPAAQVSETPSEVAAPENSLSPSTNRGDADERGTPQILQRTSLLQGESIDEYNELSDQVFEVLKPRDVIEEIWAREHVDLTWQILRERRLSNALIGSQAVHELTMILLQNYKTVDPQDVARAWARRDKATVQQVDGMLKQIGLSVPAILARATAAASRELNYIDAMSLRKSIWRNGLPCEIERHRALLERRQQPKRRRIPR